jgi:DNA-binding CsgD family transcriptional regulator
VRTAKGAYVLQLSAVTTATLGREGQYVITVIPERRRVPDAGRLRDRFSLTPREAQVANLLALGNSNRQLARALGISEHTARRHTERVLSKLGVTSRAQVAAKLSD